MYLLLAAAGLAEDPDGGRGLDELFFALSAIPFVAYFLLALGSWAAWNRQSLRRGQFSLRAMLGLLAFLAPGFVLLRLVEWPPWWCSS
jgi:hypothetical protein